MLSNLSTRQLVRPNAMQLPTLPRLIWEHVVYEPTTYVRVAAFLHMKMEIGAMTFD